MTYLNIDVIIFVVFLATNLVVGLLHSRQVVSLRDYSVGRKDFSTATLVSTIVVSWVGGWYVFEILANTYTDGLHFVIIISGAFICLWFVGQLAVRMGEFLNNLSVAEAMGDLYGKAVRVIVAAAGLLNVLTAVAMEFVVISKIITLIFDIDSIWAPWVPVVAAAIVILYSVFGGIRAVTFTDVMQFFTFGTFLPILALVIWNNLKDPQQVAHMLATNPNFNLREVIGWDPKFINTLAMFLWFVIPAIDPVVFQRISMAQNVEQARRSFSYAGIISLLAGLSLVWVAILLLANDPHLAPDKLLNHVIKNYTTPGFRGLIGIGITALAMSTADSYLNASAVLLTNDIAKPLGISFRREALFARVLCLLSGLFALLIALRIRGILKLLEFANSFYMPIVTVPLLLALFGFRSSKRAVLVGMALGVITVRSWQVFLGGSSLTVLAGMLASVTGLLGSHYLLREAGGWVGIKVKEPLIAARQRRQRAWKAFVKSIKQFRLSQYLQKNLPGQDYFFFLFGIYVIAATYASFYTIEETVRTQYASLYRIIYNSVLIAATCFLSYPIWPTIFRSKRLVSWLWPLSICYILFLVGTWLVIMSGFHEFQVMIFLLNLIMAVLLISWPLASFLAVTGVVAGIVLLQLYVGAAGVPGDFGTLQFKIFYGLLLFSSFLIALFKHEQSQEQLASRYAYLSATQQEKDKELRKALRYQERFVSGLAADCIEAVALLHQQGQELRAKLPQVASPAQVKDFMQQVATLLDKQQQGSRYLAESIYHFKDYMRLDVRVISLEDLLEQTLDTLKKIGLHPEPQVFIDQRTDRKEVQCDPQKLQRLLVNGIVSIYQQAKAAKQLTLVVADGLLGYDISFIPDYTKQVPALQFVLTTEPTMTVEQAVEAAHEPVTVFLPRNTEDLAKSENEQIIDAHYGVSVQHTSDGGVTHRYIIPAELRKIRPKLMDTAQMVLPDTADAPVAADDK
ncbi:MAG: sodium:solute symporter family protein [Bacteroidota bacterium]